MNQILNKKYDLFFTLAAIIFLLTAASWQKPAGEKALGTRKYADFQPPKLCASCHQNIYQQWTQAMMSQAYTHHWDEIEYFKLAVPQAEKDPAVAGVKAGCNGCHAPLAFLAGDVPPPAPAKNSRANESVSCDFCHTVVGFEGDIPYNFNWIVEPGRAKQGPREGKNSPEHDMVKSTFLATAEFCGTCHNEMSPYGAWVKATHLEWKEGPYAKQGVKCQDCHMTYAEGKSASMGQPYPDVRQHLFHGAHDPGKIKGTIELRLHPSVREAEPGERVKFTLILFNQKTGHKFPTGSVEDRIVWLHVEAIDSKGNIYHLPVDKKGFPGEEFTIASDELAYQDMGIALGDPNFPGLPRDGIPKGDRIYRQAYLDPQGRMTIQQWNTKSFGIDYRFGPRQSLVETFTFTIPASCPPGPLRVVAALNYQKLVKPVADFLGVPDEESEVIRVNDHETTIIILP
ncbi:MAG: multiheme c-type cytochrome [Candidatus Aminicenantales bacterium]